MADLSREESKRLRAELAEGLGFYPASVAAEDVARYREQIAERKAREEAGERAMAGSGRIQVAQVGSPEGGETPRRRRSPWPSRRSRSLRGPVVHSMQCP